MHRLYPKWPQKIGAEKTLVVRLDPEWSQTGCKRTLIVRPKWSRTQCWEPGASAEGRSGTIQYKRGLDNLCKNRNIWESIWKYFSLKGKLFGVLVKLATAQH